MPRPKLPRKVTFKASVTYFKPRGIPLSILEVVSLAPEEVESYRLRYVHNLDQKEAAKKMRISTSTYQRIINSAYKKIADAIINGKAIEINQNE